MPQTSQDAILDCIDVLNLKKEDAVRADVEAELYNNANKSRGSIWVTFFMDWHSGNLPSLEFDETIKGFRIQRQLFNSTLSQMNWDAAKRRLDVSGAGYDFSLTFEKKPRTRKHSG